MIGSCKVAATTGHAQIERNQTALRQALDGIEKHRKGPALIKVMDSNGKPVAGARLDIRQVSHAFKFGCYLKIDDLDQSKLPDYERRFKGLFNYAVIGAYWDNIENKRGIENWSWFDREAALGEKLGVTIAAAPILWGTSEFGTPRWLPANKAELMPILERRVKASIARDGRVSDWEIVNEPMAPKGDLFARALGDEYISLAFEWAKDAAPGKRRLINEYGVFGMVKRHNYNRDRYFDLLEKLIAKDAPIDVIGIQAHANGEWYEPANVAEQLARYAGLGKPIQITEFSSQTHDFDDPKSPLEIAGPYRQAVWDSEKQAEFYREFYTIAFGNPQVEAIVTWGLDDERAWLPGIGVVDIFGQPKPAYDQLDHLINNEWKTSVTGVTNNKGIFELRGFYGNYEVTAATQAGVAAKSAFTLIRSNTDVWVVRSKG